MARLDAHRVMVVADPNLVGGETVSIDVLFDSVEALVDPRAERPDEIEFLATDREQLLDAISALPEREQTILKLRYGLADREHAMTLRQIAEVVGISRERVRQREHKALEDLRRRLGASQPGGQGEEGGA